MAEAAAELPEDCARILRDLETIEAEVLALAEPLDDAAFNWRPETGGRWSLGQCIDHLVRINRLYADALEEAARQGADRGLSRQGPLRPGRLGRWFLRQMEPPVRRRFPAPSKAVPPSRIGKTATLAAFRGEQRRLAEVAQAAALLDCNALRFRNPFVWGLRVFDLATGLLVPPAHERRHLQQMRDLLAHPGFPRA